MDLNSLLMLYGIEYSRFFLFFFFKQKTAYEMCGRDWSSDVCSSDLLTISAHEYCYHLCVPPLIPLPALAVCTQVEMRNSY